MPQIKVVHFAKQLLSITIVLHIIELAFAIGMVIAGFFLTWVYYNNGREYDVMMIIGIVSILTGCAFAHRGFCGVFNQVNNSD